MAERDRLHGGDTGFVTVFARAPHLCAGALAGLGSALWLNVVGPFAGLVAVWGALVLVNALAVALVAVLAMLVTTAGTLLAADWRADVASRQAWADIDVAAAQLRPPAGRVTLPQIDPRYLTANENEGLRNVFRAHQFAPPAPADESSTGPLYAARTAQAVAAPDGFIPSLAAPEAALTIARKISTAPASDAAMAGSLHRKAASASLGQEPLVVASCRARLQVVRAEPAVRAARRIANGGAWSEWLTRDRCMLTRGLPDGHSADIVVLSGDRRDRDQCDFSGPPTRDGTVERDEPPSCRGPPSAVGQRSRPQQTRPVARSVENPGYTGAAGALPSADPIVHDNLGRQVPVCAAELDVIETYLDQVLRDLLGSCSLVPDSEKS